ncbi:MAG: hypothetical protein PVF83_08340 [Anaerolineales bacterium]
MNKTPFFRKKSYENWLILLLLLIVVVICYGLLIPWLGFYFDDWPLIYVYKTRGLSGFVDFYQYDRPLLIWTHALTFPFIGTSRVGWHIAALFFRWLTVAAMWWTLYGLWPSSKRRITWMAIIFAVYPAFFQQPVSVNYSQVFLISTFVFISLGSMIWAYRKPKYYWPFTILSWGGAALHLFTVESWFGLELLRPVLLWYVLNEGNQKVADHIRRTIKKWLPFLLLLIVYIIWRFFFLELPGGGSNSPILLVDLISSPFSTFYSLFETVFKDVSYLIIYVWALTLDPNAMVFSQPFVLFSWIIVFAAAVCLFFWMKKTRIFESESQSNNEITRQGLFLGIYGILVGFLPVWIAGRSLVGRSWTDRFALFPMFGASILVVALLNTLVKNMHKTVILCVFVGLAVGAQLRNENSFRWEWNEQVQFYWQLYWRTPNIEPGTSIMNEDALFRYTSKYSASMALNTLYPSNVESQNDLPYWVFELQDEISDSTDRFTKGEVLKDGIRNYQFTGHSRDSLILFYEPSSNKPGECLWVLSSVDENNIYLPYYTNLIVGSANFDRIDVNGEYDWKPDEGIFGPEPAHTWCYYYQKASLARQLSDWGKVTELLEEAEALGFQAKNPYEFFPFIEGYAHQGEWETAQELTEDAHEILTTQDKRESFEGTICSVWNSLEENTSPSEERDVVIEEIYEMANCH